MFWGKRWETTIVYLAEKKLSSSLVVRCNSTFAEEVTEGIIWPDWKLRL